MDGEVLNVQKLQRGDELCNNCVTWKAAAVVSAVQKEQKQQQQQKKLCIGFSVTSDVISAACLVLRT